MNLELSEDYVNKFINNKKILVLGSARCVAHLTTSFMEDFEIIVRCNNYKHFNECRRVDIYYSFLGGSIKKSIDDIISDGTKFIFCRCPDMDFSQHVGGKYIPGRSFDARPLYKHRREKCFFRIPYYIQTFKNYRHNYHLCDRLLSTGVSAIVDVLRYDPKYVYIAGYDFFTQLFHNTNEPCSLNTGHNFAGEFDLVKQLVAKGRVECTKQMKKLFARGNWHEIKAVNDEKI